MKSYKFRAWDKNRGKNGIMLENHTFESISATGLATYDDLIWMQFTGLKDKNGVEIYEGDILQCYDGETWKAVFELSQVGQDWMSWPEDYEVIGNIYENPDLLTSGT